MGVRIRMCSLRELVQKSARHFRASMRRPVFSVGLEATLT